MTSTAILANRVINVAVTAAISLITLAVTYGLRGGWPFSPVVANGVIGIALLVLVAGAYRSVAPRDDVLDRVASVRAARFSATSPRRRRLD